MDIPENTKSQVSRTRTFKKKELKGIGGLWSNGALASPAWGGGVLNPRLTWPCAYVELVLENHASMAPAGILRCQK